MTATLVAGVVAAALGAQVPKEPAKDLFMHSEEVPGLTVRFVDYHWQPALFEAMEKGAKSVPEAARDWVVARLMVETRPFVLAGVKMPVGSYALTLWPNLDGRGMAVEVRRVDMRDVFPDVNALAPAPKGETIYKGPARFETARQPASRLTVRVEDKAGTVVVTLLYGDRRLSLPLAR